MKKLLPFFILCILVSGCSKTSKDCNYFKTGTFKYSNPKLKHFTIIRNDTMQIELDKTKRNKMVGVIKWVSRCQYVLTYKEVSKTEFDFLINTQITVDITPISERSYKYYAYDKEGKISGEIIKVDK